MPPDNRDAAHLWDMLAAARESCSIVADIPLENFLEDRLRLRALERTMELTGEAARRISAGSRLELAEIPWQALIGLRNVLAHEYGRINATLLYRTATHDLPSLIITLERVVGSNV
jgi:uncharacterized protein with HEPN domain